VGRILLGFLAGLISGFLITVYFFHRGGGDLFLTSSPRVQQLEHSLQRATEEQERTAKKLEEAATIIERLNGRYTELEHRLQALASQPAPSQLAPPSPTEDTASTGEQPSP
jgi:hypothetical protein